jgi:hypothetical protein
VLRRLGPAAFVALALVSACHGQPAGPLSLSLVPATSTTPAFVRVSGLSSSELSALASAHLSDDAWTRVLRVTVDDRADALPVVGRVTVAPTGLEFTPRFAFDPGRTYHASFDPAQMPAPRATPAIREALSIAATTLTPTTTVMRVLPTPTTLPENLLRMYLEFSAPMSRDHGRDFLKLLDEQGHEVKDAFLALDVDFWSPDGRRYTVFFDPGRVKRGILPNDLYGRALTAGHRYTIVVDPRWRDANGQPLAAGFSHAFSVGPADMAALRLEDWRLRAPAAGTRDPLVVTFPKPLDHGLLQRALGVASGATVVAGDAVVGAGETEWRFTPASPWPARQFDLVVLSILEDPMGNKVGQPFDVDTFDRIDKSSAPERRTIPFQIR